MIFEHVNPSMGFQKFMDHARTSKYYAKG